MEKPKTMESPKDIENQREKAGTGLESKAENKGRLENFYTFKETLSNVFRNESDSSMLRDEKVIEELSRFLSFFYTEINEKFSDDPEARKNFRLDEPSIKFLGEKILRKQVKDSEGNIDIVKTLERTFSKWIQRTVKDNSTKDTIRDLMEKGLYQKGEEETLFQGQNVSRAEWFEQYSRKKNKIGKLREEEANKNSQIEAEKQELDEKEMQP